MSATGRSTGSEKGLVSWRPEKSTNTAAAIVSWRIPQSVGPETRTDVCNEAYEIRGTPDVMQSDWCTLTPELSHVRQ